ncbi:MAG: beta-(1-6) glucans synthase [Parvibaculum sp.]|uniref:glycoside hydrolase family 17 protein n=1 Tax=Parvibaculum sp. TaxID=2024848 RepID=UPI003C70E104
MKMAPVTFLLGLVATALITVFIWKFLGAPVDMVDAPAGKVHCVSYTPYRGSDTPFNPDFIADPARIEADLVLLSSVTDCVRIYSVDLGLAATVPLAAKHGMQVLLGIWIGMDEEKNAKQIAQAIELANAYPKAIRAIIVGNEVLLRGEQTPDDLVRYLKTVKEATGLPVTYADVTDFWMKAPPALADAADFVTIHILPYWENNPTSAAEGVNYLKSVREDVAAHFPGKRIFIGETGFPSHGRERGGAVPSIVSEARYLREFAAYAESVDLDYNLIEAFDQPWKRALEGTVGGHWGFFTTDREPKFPWTGPVSEHPKWRLEAGSSFALSLLVLMIMAWRGGKPEALGGLAAGFGAGFAGTALLLQAEHSIVAWRTPLEGAVELLLFAQSLAVVVFVLPEITKKRQAAGPMPIAATLDWLRAPNRACLGMPLYLGLTQLAVAFSAMVVSMGLSFDNRYRDFPLAAFGLAALSLALLALNRGDHKRALPNRREETLFALLFIVNAGVIAFNEGPHNAEALTWCLLNLLFALPWIGNLKAAVFGVFSSAADAKA